MATSEKDGGPALPFAYIDATRPGVREQVVCHGMSMRQYFVAHAPAFPQEWFKPVLSKRPDNDWRVGDWRATSFDSAVAHSKDHGGYVRNENEAAQSAYDADIEHQRFIQWPYAWADAMLAEGERRDKL